jgi:hypothetical protein
MDWGDIQKLIVEGEGSRIDFKETPFLTSDSREIAADLVCFANRHGGYILVGIKNDGTKEGERINKDKSELHILNIANNNCSPTLELSFDYFTATDGDVLVITIHRRRGMPSAVVERSGAEIKHRSYYIRSGSRKKLVDDITLEFIFGHVEDPNVSTFYYISIWYKRGDFILSPIHFPSYASFMLPYLQDIQRKKEASYLFEKEEPRRVRALFLEVLPYTFLHHAGLKLGHSWLTRVERFGSGPLYTPVRTDLPTDTLFSHSLPISGVNLLPKLSLDIQKILQEFHYELKLPKGTTVDIDIKNDDLIQGMSSIKFKNPSFELNITFRPQVWSVGIPYPLTNKLFTELNDIQDLFG